MTKYIIKRLLIALPTLIGITIIDYAIMCFAGSPLEMMQGARISQAAVAAKEAALGLDKPFYIQYIMWLGQLLQGLGLVLVDLAAQSVKGNSHGAPYLAGCSGTTAKKVRSPSLSLMRLWLWPMGQ